MPVLTTPRLRLAPMPPGAAAALPHDREESSEQLGAQIHPDWPQADLLDVLPIHARLSDAGTAWGIWPLVELSSLTVIGSVGFHGPPDERGSVEIGYDVVPDRRRQGYCTEGAQALMRWANQEHAVKRFRARCAPGNLASIRSLERLGFRPIGQPDEFIHWRLQGRRLRRLGQEVT